MATPVRSAIRLDALYIEKQAAAEALAQRRATSIWGYMVYALGAPTGVLVAVAGLSAVTANTTAAVVFAILATISASLMNVMNPAAKVAEHKTAGSRFHAIENRIHAFVDIDLLTEASDDELVAKFDRLLTEFNEADEKSPDVADRLFNRAYLTVRENPRFADLRADGLASEGRRLGAERGWRLGRKARRSIPAPV